jgi:hypothetical protein
MGFFSWITQDTGRSISNNSSDMGSFRVIMLDNKGNKWVEDDYDGYGEFGGKDYYELLAEMNGKVNPTRDEGIDIAFKQNSSGDKTPGVLYPNLVESESWEWSEVGPESCEHQGFFYPDEEEDAHRAWYNHNEDDE